MLVTGEEFPEHQDWIPCPLKTSSGDFTENNKKIFFQFKTEEQKHGNKYSVETN